ncbi:hypothetical protein J3458_001589 [Metarhizium acridum]|uniref:uncharacterized protein n=1 Tax=Metarhizium acridum TaxID=92637 RepID=UPI001C6BEE42|nr:hypothetical protein J3458_001589 [Metarhizium acridum]
MLPLRLTNGGQGKAFAKEDEELQRLNELIRKDSSDAHQCPTIVLHGPGGIGKTELAMGYAREFKDQFSAVFWISAETHQAMEMDT